MGLTIRAAACALLSLSFARPALAQSPVYYKVVDHGKDVNLGFYYSINPDCSARGFATAAVGSPPQGGQVLSVHSRDFPSFSSTNPRFVCNKRRIEGTKVWYRANPGFRGTDSFVLQIVDANGDPKNFNVQVAVR